MSISNFSKTHKKWNLFKEIDVLGSYDFFTSIVHLSSLKPIDIQGMNSAIMFFGAKGGKETNKLTSEQYSMLSKVLPLAAHEYTHFIDSTSTLWGLRHLAMLNEAYLADNKMGGSEYEFHLARRFYDHARSIHLPKYYTTIEDKVSDVRPWQSKITMGKIFTSDGSPSGKPVLFSRFLNANNESLTRSPISAISILEASAMAQELFMQSRLINQSESDFRTIENNLSERKIMSDLYNKNLTEYSVCVHVLSNRLGCSEGVASFSVCAVLTRLVLNMPKSCLNTVLKECDVARVVGIPSGHEFELRMLEGIKQGDLGILFYLLCCALPRRDYTSHPIIMQGVNRALKKLGLTISAMTLHGQIEAKKLHGDMQHSKIDSVRDLAGAGYSNFLKLGYNSGFLDFNELNIPPVLLEDFSSTNIFSSTNNSLANFDINKSYDELVSGQEWVERFSEACL